MKYCYALLAPFAAQSVLGCIYLTISSSKNDSKGKAQLLDNGSLKCNAKWEFDDTDKTQRVGMDCLNGYAAELMWKDDKWYVEFVDTPSKKKAVDDQEVGKNQDDDDDEEKDDNDSKHFSAGWNGCGAKDQGGVTNTVAQTSSASSSSSSSSSTEMAMTTICGTKSNDAAATGTTSSTGTSSTGTTSSSESASETESSTSSSQISQGSASNLVAPAFAPLVALVFNLL